MCMPKRLEINVYLPRRGISLLRLLKVFAYPINPAIPCPYTSPGLLVLGGRRAYQLLHITVIISPLFMLSWSSNLHRYRINQTRIRPKLPDPQPCSCRKNGKRSFGALSSQSASDEMITIVVIKPLFRNLKQKVLTTHLKSMIFFSYP